MSVERATAHLPSHLAGLKRHGGGVLVVGADGHDAFCQRFRGAAAAERRVLSLSPQRCRCDGEQGRNATPVATPGGEDAPALSRLSWLGHDVLDRIDTLADRGLEPAELRVCIESLDRFVGTAGFDRAGLLLETVLERTRAASGLAHAHTTAGYSSDTVRRLEPHFDAVVEVTADPAPRQRWHFPTDDPDTGWLPLRD